MQKFNINSSPDPSDSDIQNKLCETTPDVKSYSGYVHLPPGTADLGQGQDYPINTVIYMLP